MTPESLEALQQQRAQILGQIAQLDDLRPGSITSTTGRCGKPDCRCHQPNQSLHGPNLRLTFKLESKTVTESLPNPAAVTQAEREIAEFRKFEKLSREFVDVNARICHLRPAQEQAQTQQGKKRPKRSTRKSPAK